MKIGSTSIEEEEGIRDLRKRSHEKSYYSQSVVRSYRKHHSPNYTRKIHILLRVLEETQKCLHLDVIKEGKREMISRGS